MRMVSTTQHAAGPCARARAHAHDAVARDAARLPRAIERDEVHTQPLPHEREHRGVQRSAARGRQHEPPAQQAAEEPAGAHGPAWARRAGMQCHKHMRGARQDRKVTRAQLNDRGMHMRGTPSGNAKSQKRARAYAADSVSASATAAPAATAAPTRSRHSAWSMFQYLHRARTTDCCVRRRGTARERARTRASRPCASAPPAAAPPAAPRAQSLHARARARARVCPTRECARAPCAGRTGRRGECVRRYYAPSAREPPHCSVLSSESTNVGSYLSPRAAGHA